MIAVRNGQGTFFQQTVRDSQHVDTEYIEYCLLRSSGHSYFLLSLRPQSNVKLVSMFMDATAKWLVTLLDLCVCHPFVSDCLSQLKVKSEHMYAGGVSC